MRKKGSKKHDARVVGLGVDGRVDGFKVRHSLSRNEQPDSQLSIVLHIPQPMTSHYPTTVDAEQSSITSSTAIFLPAVVIIRHRHSK